MRLGAEDIAALAAALTDSPYDVLRLDGPGYALLLRREASGWSAEATVQGEPPLAVQAPPGAIAAEAEAGPVIRAPLVGTFYRAPKPGAPPFINLGSEVTPHTVIGIVETMKLINSVHAGVSGRVVEIVADDATFVETGQVLMRIEAAPS